MLPRMDHVYGYDQPSDRPPSFNPESGRMSTNGRCTGNDCVIVLVFAYRLVVSL